MKKPSRKYIEYCLKVTRSPDNEFPLIDATKFISQELGYGEEIIGKKKFRIDSHGRNQLREWLKHQGIDWSGKESLLKGSYIKVAANAVDEKLSSEAVSKYWIKIKSLGSKPARVNNTKIKLPRYAHLTIDYRLIKSIKCDWILIVENLAVFEKFENMLINNMPESPALVVFRGSPQIPYGYQWVKKYREKHQSVKLAVCSDFDPAGIEIAMNANPDAVIFPELKSLIDLKANPYDYNNQKHQYDRLKNSITSKLKPWVEFLGNIKGGYTQERLIANNIPLVFIDLQGDDS